MEYTNFTSTHQACPLAYQVLQTPKQYVPITPELISKSTLHVYSWNDEGTPRIIAQYRRVYKCAGQVKDEVISAVTGRVLRGNDLFKNDRLLKIPSITRIYSYDRVTPELKRLIIESWKGVKEFEDSLEASCNA